MSEERIAVLMHLADEYANLTAKADEEGDDLSTSEVAAECARDDLADALQNALGGEPVGWIPVTERMPEPETECLVWTHPSYSKQPLALLDRWGEQHEAPVSWSSATIPIGLGWGSSKFEDVTHWMPIMPPRAP